MSASEARHARVAENCSPCGRRDHRGGMASARWSDERAAASVRRRLEERCNLSVLSSRHDEARSPGSFPA